MEGTSLPEGVQSNHGILPRNKLCHTRFDNDFAEILPEKYPREHLWTNIFNNCFNNRVMFKQLNDVNFK